LPLASAERPALVVGAVALVLLLVGIAVLEVANFIADQFARATWLGVVSLAAIAPAALILLWSVIREWRSYSALAQIDALRRGLASASRNNAACIRCRAASRSATHPPTWQKGATRA
jgi:putative membrane protein